jgi:lipoprotein-anchoring transpeptidase ErfK/SrfK
MAGGPGNPLGARALYLGHSVFRIHGTNHPETIGHAVSSGCFRLDNADVIDLYDRVQVGAKVLVRQSDCERRLRRRRRLQGRLFSTLTRFR